MHSRKRGFAINQLDIVTQGGCSEATLNLEAINLDASQSLIDMFTSECFDVQYKLKAGCKTLSSVKTQGGFGANLIITPYSTTKGSIKVKTLKGGNNIFIWTISDGLAPEEEATLSATVCIGTNKKGKQQYTSCGPQPLTGEWSSTAVVAADGLVIFSTPVYTDPLMIEVNCP